jgi:hypothetical protein
LPLSYLRYIALPRHDYFYLLLPHVLLVVMVLSEQKELVITKDDYLCFLSERLRLQGSCRREIENINFPFLFASGSELLRTYILGATEFTSNLPDKYRLPDRGFIWYLFSQSVKEIQVMREKIVIKYELQDEYRKPFKQFYL